MSTQEEAAKLLRDVYFDHPGDRRAAIKRVASALDACDMQIAELCAKLAAAEQRAREAEVRGLERAKQLLKNSPQSIWVMQEITLNTEIARLRAEKESRDEQIT